MFASNHYLKWDNLALNELVQAGPRLNTVIPRPLIVTQWCKPALSLVMLERLECTRSANNSTIAEKNKTQLEVEVRMISISQNSVSRKERSKRR